ncbi:MAG: YebC/PmpR family DNA-binding transcriptional regulator [Gammaproteobacteria bacterium]|nr:YebC/PmpR family DNA-binding transcriptional regulator [Gammaproteobacteria bacterium]MBU6509905.1 YebC/PmpR family DNA-binding transcriptional regulator [Gammaproteobacteria bacterium]MDE1983290.1 YebC/PmpR family DNA-binding transcriptional regulator [Gammaproteobacteria bacterium]MDE2107853.1 YebC/PmpR family DNA-binding transcriptional regulator [Gammaproteobacteria bacterium]MDE2460696.1 YebC/PmpR family DNA-binding transcriptional regulator [Gammaproteobacteria bacterium]
MSGHSKWANIQHRKSAQDAKRGKLFTRLIREITTAARHGDPNPDHNPRLRLAVDSALAGNMTRDTIDRAIKRGAGELGGAALEEARYEGYAPGGVAVIVECLTDNRTRTVGEVRHAFTKHAGNLGADGSVGYLFNKCGVLRFPAGTSEDKLMTAALDAGAEDIVSGDDGSFEVLTDPAVFHKVKADLERAGLKPESAEVTLRASTAVALSTEQAPAVLELLEALEDLDDVQAVYSNAEFPEAMLKAS